MDPREHAKSVRALVHEFNNLLFIIGGHCEMLTQQLPDPSQALSDVHQIYEATERATTLTAQLRALAIAHAAAAEAADGGRAQAGLLSPADRTHAGVPSNVSAR
jgi:nitrogen-specific signal transduction histidine kinase